MNQAKSMDEEIVFTDRYQALGIPYPDPATMCRGQCEGIGAVPHKPLWLCEYESICLPGPDEPEFNKRWLEAHQKVAWWKRLLWALHILHFDGWHFVKCPRCEGTGKEPAERITDEHRTENHR